MNDEPRAFVWTGDDNDEVVVETTDEAISLWDRIENMQAAQITVGEVKELRDEIERLRFLITAWADACDLMMVVGSLDTTTPEGVAACNALVALRKAVGR